MVNVMKSINSKFLSIFFSSLIAGFLVAISIFAWNNPTATPPNGDSALYYASSTGNFGIGTTTPASKLSIDGSDNSFAWGGDHSSAGYIRIGNVQICWGNGTATNPTQPYYVAYSTFAFPSGCVFTNTTYTLIANPTNGSTNGKAFTQWQTGNGTQGTTVYFHKISDASQEDATATGNVPFTWMAIGTWR